MEKIYTNKLKALDEFYIGVQILFFIGISIIQNDQYNKYPFKIFISMSVFYLLLRVLMFLEGYNAIKNNNLNKNFKNYLPFFESIILVIFGFLVGKDLFYYTGVYFIYLIFQITRYPKKNYIKFNFLAFFSFLIPILFLEKRRIISKEFFLVFIFIFSIGFIIHNLNKEMNRLEVLAKDFMKELKESNLKLKEMAERDFLTGLYNHKSFYEFVHEYMSRCINNCYPLSLALIDIDEFKKINDTYGHIWGDYVLKEIAKIIKQNIRSTDIAARYGGEEFGVLFPNTERKKAKAICERIRKKIQEYDFNYKDQSIKITVSTGVTQKSEKISIKEVHNFVDDADKLLYKAKNNGKNIVIAS